MMGMAVKKTLTGMFISFLYVLCFIPAAYILKLIKHDPMGRKPDPFRVSYWTAHEKQDVRETMKYPL